MLWHSIIYSLYLGTLSDLSSHKHPLSPCRCLTAWPAQEESSVAATTSPLRPATAQLATTARREKQRPRPMSAPWATTARRAPPALYYAPVAGTRMICGSGPARCVLLATTVTTAWVWWSSMIPSLAPWDTTALRVCIESSYAQT